MPFTDEHHPSLKASTPPPAEKRPHARAQLIETRDTYHLVSRPTAITVVQCRECEKPRVIYSRHAISNMKAHAPPAAGLTVLEHLSLIIYYES
jgi:hypothetical protein